MMKRARVVAAEGTSMPTTFAPTVPIKAAP